MNEGKVHLEFEYNQINKILETKDFIVLKTSSQSAILVFKEGFATGNKEDFFSLLIIRCKKITIRKGDRKMAELTSLKNIGK